MDTTEFAKRMKGYEAETNHCLKKKIPVIIRIDGRAFHTFTKGFAKPYDKELMKCMQNTMLYLCQNIQGCVFGYTQSDEITLVLTDYKNEESSAWFDYNIKKLCSIAASMTTLKFYQELSNVVKFEGIVSGLDSNNKVYQAHAKALSKGATFDSRCFNVPVEDVCNNIYWRQSDAIRNSIQLLGQAYFTHRELDKKSTKMIKAMLFERGIDWDKEPIAFQHGSACIKELDENSGREKWEIDKEMPILRGENRKYVERFV